MMFGLVADILLPWPERHDLGKPSCKNSQSQTKQTIELIRATPYTALSWKIISSTAMGADLSGGFASDYLGESRRCATVDP
ncbi:uncharacterized protein TrAtP1_001982 [Trichoderma atroviride]|uniref:uncharacterized protein n=1 Tax=Hypocrea atroviridis TaxID=63577 RepID=UPI00331DBF95|nr:hypothetical protein TrAtP1_001982 [Trichoderma atroviride]